MADGPDPKNPDQNRPPLAPGGAGPDGGPDRQPKAEDIGTLIQRAQQGDRRAQERLLDMYRPWLRLLAERRLGTRQPGGQNASDLVQMTLVNAAGHFGGLQAQSRPELEAWLQRILQRSILRVVRDAGRQKRGAAETVPLDEPGRIVVAPGASPSQEVSHRQQWLRLLRVIATLPPGQREAVWLRHLEDRPLPEIATRLGRSEGAVISLIRRGVDTLRATLRKDSAPPGAAPKEDADPAHEAQLDRALHDCLTRLTAHGGTLSADERARLLGDHPACAAALSAYLDFTDQLRQLSQDSP